MGFQKRGFILTYVWAANPDLVGRSTLVGAMMEGARCWADEAEKPRFGSAAVQITYMLAWCAKFLAILHI